MKGLGWPLLFAPLLWACGTAAGPSLSSAGLSGPALQNAASVPPISAGELLAAPTKLAIGGMKISAEATPYLSALTCVGRPCAGNFVVPVTLRSSTGPLNTFKVTGVYVITEGGVWRSGVESQDRRHCSGAANCLQAVGRGSANLSSSDAVQVVLMFQDAAGKTYKLRDSKAVVSGGQ
ncbi:hypothetical protein EHF33_09555 [Deinococcus psychrotolerans]|uniref:Lipoprotein n=1 Tax=Deinococcus psychrotolerans TaxID=2489213 RepID=A0A3G8YCB0_9DEIO|nr:hypothetical protein [Deinococcus psychrotolerans]AZI42958.1 hypothetical protein EHF33_09555 [Deinococcus psychrotolerans]